MAKLTRIRKLGRYKNTETGKEYNLSQGFRPQRGTDIIFYLIKFQRNYVSDRDFYNGVWTKVS